MKLKPYVVFVLVNVVIVLAFGGYSYHSYIELAEKNRILAHTNLGLGNRLEALKKSNIGIFKAVQYTSALLDYRLKILPGVDITYTEIEEKDGCLLTYKSILYKSRELQNILTVMNYVQNRLLPNPSLIYLLDLKQEKDLWILVIDFYSVASKVVK